MEVNNIWAKLVPSGKLEILKKDIAEGKVPDLPFHIIGQEDLKASIKKKIVTIDSGRMLTNLIVANFGNGKTNVLKYLQSFFKTYNDLGISVQYSRADVERTDLVLFLLKIIQDNYLDDLIRIIKLLSIDKDAVAPLMNNYENNFSEIKQYSQKLFQEGNLDEITSELIYLGTGRLYNKRYFEKYKLEQLKDFNRREILVLFLNILSYDKKYIIFEIDEIEKIREKSKIRFNHFLTSYRELVDLFNQINGHYLIVSFTQSVGNSVISEANEALYTRIQDDVISIDNLKKKEDLLALIEYLDELFVTKQNDNFQDILTQVLKKELVNNRVIIQEISKLLYEVEIEESLNEMLIKADLISIYYSTETKLEKDEAFKNIHRKFFDPFEHYIDSIGLVSDDLNKQERVFIDLVGEKAHYFLFNTYLEDFENEKIKINKLVEENPGKAVIVYSPTNLELTHSKLNLDIDENVKIIDFEPKELFILFVMYKEHYDLQPKLSDIISKYTKKKL
jgi:hypothetical protein